MQRARVDRATWKTMMTMIVRRTLLKLAVASFTVASFGASAAHAVDLRIGWQPIVEP